LYLSTQFNLGIALLVAVDLDYGESIELGLILKEKDFLQYFNQKVAIFANRKIKKLCSISVK